MEENPVKPLRDLLSYIYRLERQVEVARNLITWKIRKFTKRDLERLVEVGLLKPSDIPEELQTDFVKRCLKDP